MVWGTGLNRVFEGWQLVQHISVGLACPFHCGSSGLPLFVAGLALGLSVGFVCCLLLGAYLFYLVRPGFVSPSPSKSQEAASPPASSALRLRAYLHEHPSRRGQTAS